MFISLILHVKDTQEILISAQSGLYLGHITTGLSQYYDTCACTYSGRMLVT